MKISPPPDQLPDVSDARVAIVQSKWHAQYVDAMVTRCLQVFERAGCKAPPVHVLPGAVELPLAARRVIRRDRTIDAVIAFGAVLKGDTYHFEVVWRMCTDGLNQVMLEEDVPIIMEVLAVSDLDQLAQRCADDEFNKGVEAAVAAIEMIYWRRQNSS